MRINQLDELITALVDHRIRTGHDKETFGVLSGFLNERGMIRLECGRELNVPEVK